MLSREQLKVSEERIDQSGLFCALVTEDMLKDEQCLYEWNYAKNKGKEFALIIKKGNRIPEEMLKGANVVYKKFFEKPEDLNEIGMDFRKRFGRMEVLENQ